MCNASPATCFALQVFHNSHSPSEWVLLGSCFQDGGSWLHSKEFLPYSFRGWFYWINHYMRLSFPIVLYFALLQSYGWRLEYSTIACFSFVIFIAQAPPRGFVVREIRYSFLASVAFAEPVSNCYVAQVQLLLCSWISKTNGRCRWWLLALTARWSPLFAGQSYLDRQSR